MTIVDSVSVSCAEAFGFSGQPVEVKLREGPVQLVVRIDEGEHARRCDAGLGAIISRKVLTALWELPTGAAIPESSLPAWVADRLQGAPAAVVERRGDSLIRAVRPPLRIGGALAIARRADRALARVGQVSALTPMAVVVLGAVDPADPIVLEAQLYGVGVASVLGGDVTTLAAAAAVTPMPGPYLWWVTELAYQQMGGDQLPFSPTR